MVLNEKTLKYSAKKRSYGLHEGSKVHDTPSIPVFLPTFNANCIDVQDPMCVYTHFFIRTMVLNEKTLKYSAKNGLTVYMKGQRSMILPPFQFFCPLLMQIVLMSKILCVCVCVCVYTHFL